MYESYFELTQRPFSLLPDPRFLYLGKKHGTALTLLEYGLVEQAGFTVLTGEVGCGKTTLIRHLLDRMESDTRVGLITQTRAEPGELLRWVLLAFELDHRVQDEVERYRVFQEFLLAEYAQGRHAVLIIDEAQNLSAEVLEEIRMLSNINSGEDQLLQIILAGQPELLDTLRRPALRQFVQRVAVDYYIEPLNQTETYDYVRHRLRVAGRERALFRRAATDLVYEYSAGVPRLINLICDTALVYGYAAGRRTITERAVREVITDKMDGLHAWRKPSPVVVPAAGSASRMESNTVAEPHAHAEPESSRLDRLAATEYRK